MSLSRRALMRRTAATGAAAIGVGAGAHHAGVSTIGSASAQTLSDATTVIGLAAGGPAYLAYDYVANDGENTLDLFLGDTRDLGGYADGSILHSEIIASALRMASADERVFTSIENNIASSENVALAKGKAAAIEEMNAGSSQSTASNAMTAAVDSYYSTIEQNIIVHLNEQINQIDHHMTEVDNHPDLSLGQVFYRHYPPGSTKDNGVNAHDLYTHPYTTVDGTEVQTNYLVYKDNSDANDWGISPIFGANVPNIDNSNEYTMRIYAEDGSYNGLDDASYLEAYGSQLDTVTSRHSTVISDLSGFVSDVYAQWEPDEIPTADLVDPITAATEMGQDYDHTAMRSAQAAMLGIPTQDARTLTLEVHTDGDTSTDGTIVQGSIFTEHVPTDGSGNEVGFTTGTVYEPSTWSVPLYVAYDWSQTDEDGVITDSEEDFVQLESPFELIEAVDADGNSVESFKTKNTNAQTADVTKLREEIDQLNNSIADLREKEQAEADSGGGGGGWIRQNPLATALGGVVAIGAVFLAGSESSER